MGDLPRKLLDLAESLTLALDRLPGARNLEPDEDASALSIKNELLLSHLQNLVLVLILKIRGISARLIPPKSSSICTNPRHDAVVQSLVAIRVYFEKGVRPLESRLKYQIVRLLDQANRLSIRAGANFGRRTSISNRQVRNGVNQCAPSRITTLSDRPGASLRAPRRPPKNAISNAPPTYLTQSSLAPHSSKEQSPQRGQESAESDDSTLEEMSDYATVTKQKRGSHQAGSLPRGNGSRKRTVGLDSSPGGGSVNGGEFAGGRAKRVRRETEQPPAAGPKVAIRMHGRYYIGE